MLWGESLGIGWGLVGEGVQGKLGKLPGDGTTRGVRGWADMLLGIRVVSLPKIKKRRKEMETIPKEFVDSTLSFLCSGHTGP